jgi:1-acyl-sn-glycerol-3-phosphate acyltransferase
MQDFESIRPYHDDEVPRVLRRLVRDPDVLMATAGFFVPRLARALPGISRWLAGRMLKRRTRDLRSIDDVQQLLTGYFETAVRRTVEEFTVSGLDALTPGQSYLFVSNHRDIVMDTGFLNYALHMGGHDTTRIAVGDNLLAERYAADLMRLNKSFIIERSTTGAKAVFAALSRSSRYIRHSLEEGESVWIAQREGRAKDGLDRTDPAIIKMFSLAYRKEIDDMRGWLAGVRLIPVAVSYELDPCDLRKAHELNVRATHGDYEKPPEEDLESIVEGITGYKGRVHLAFAPAIRAEHESAEDVAAAIDQAIVGNLRVFPTHIRAAELLGERQSVDVPEALPSVERAFAARLGDCPASDRELMLRQYANLLHNREVLGILS